MIQELTDRFAAFVTTHDRLVIVLMLVLTAGVAFGITQDQGEVDQGVDDDAIGDTDVAQAHEYIEERYGDDEEQENLTTADVYVIEENESALTQESLLAAIDYQQAVLADETVADALADDGVEGAPNMIGAHLAGNSDADLETQYEAIAAASDEELASAITTIFDGGEATTFYLPRGYEVGTTDAESFRMTFTFATDEEVDADQPANLAATDVLHDTAGEYEEVGIFVSGQPAWEQLNEKMLADAAWLVIPAVLMVLLLILGFAYRDFTDVLIGFTGTVIALIWTAGLMGWMGLLNQQTALIAPVLVAALSIDFGFHVFMRYRERRGPGDGIRTALRRSTGAVTMAFLLVTVTAAVGFLSNLTSPVPVIRDIGVAITLGVVGALIVFTTLVPALKVSADGLWERFGFDRRKTALGKGRYLSHILGFGATAARRASVAVIALALLVALGGGMAFIDLDREAFQQADVDEAPDWQTELPGEMAVEVHESDVAQNIAYVQQSYQSDQDGATEGGSGYTTILIEGENGVATGDAMATAAAGHEAAQDADEAVVIRQNGDVQVVSVLTLMETVASQDEEFAAALDTADTTNDGVPDENVAALFDQLFEVAPDQAEQLIERTDDGTYESMLLLVPAQQDFGSERAEAMHNIADEMGDGSDSEVTAVGIGTIQDAELAQIADGVVLTMLLAMGGILLALAVVYRFVHRSLTLGAVTVVPILLALGLVFGGMYILDVPLTMLTALLVSITIGLGIDYNIHVSDRFVQELERGRDAATALREAVTGTGGALLGSAVTSGGAFSLIALLPHPQFTSFGLIVALALGVSFLLSVFVLPSLLWLWVHHGRSAHAKSAGTEASLGD